MIARGIGVAALLAGAVWSVNALCVQKYRCEQVKARVQASSTLLFNHPGEYKVRVAARRHLEELAPCLDRDPNDIELMMIAAVNLRLLERFDEAADQYRRANRVEERPEIDYSLGMTLLQAGRTEEAIEPLTRASLFNPTLMYDIPDEPVQARVRRLVLARDQRARQNQQNH